MNRNIQNQHEKASGAGKNDEDCAVCGRQSVAGTAVLVFSTGIRDHHLRSDDDRLCLVGETTTCTTQQPTQLHI